MNLNKVILIGRISTDVTLNESRSGVSFARFNLAITRDSFSNTREDITDFIHISAFRNTAIFISKFFNKGDLVCVTGSLQSSQYTTKNGDVVSSISVVADQIKSLEPKSVTQARAEKTSSLNVDNNQSTFYSEKTKDNDEKTSDENPWELDF